MSVEGNARQNDLNSGGRSIKSKQTLRYRRDNLLYPFVPLPTRRKGTQSQTGKIRDQGEQSGSRDFRRSPVYAISDIHGCAELLRQMFIVIDRDLETLGSMRASTCSKDYIDRGPDSARSLTR
jgi:hypothetical protein